VSITTTQYLALKPGDKVIPNEVYWHDRAGEIVVIAHAATIDKRKWDKDAHDCGYSHPNDIPAEELHECNVWLGKWVYARPLDSEPVYHKSLLPMEIDRVLLVLWNSCLTTILPHQIENCFS